LILPSNVITVYSTPTGGELIFHTAQGDQVFFSDPDTKIFVDPELELSAGPNQLKMSVSPDGKFCLANTGKDCPQTRCRDSDDDGFENCADDCNDENASIHPGAVELCDRVDNDCDGLIDETFDVDSDGYPSDAFTAACAVVYTLFYCDDNDVSVNDGAPEICDGKDNDCNGTIDDGIVSQLVCPTVIQPQVGICENALWKCDDTTGGTYKCYRADLGFVVPKAKDCTTLDADNNCDGVFDVLQSPCFLSFYVDFNTDGIELNPLLNNDFLYDVLKAESAVGNGDVIEPPGIVLSLGTGRNDSGIFPTVSSFTKVKYAALSNLDLTRGTFQVWLKSDTWWSDDEERTLFFANGTDEEGFIRLFKNTNNKLILEYRIGTNAKESSISVDSWSGSFDPTFWHLLTITWMPDQSLENIRVDTYVDIDQKPPKSIPINKWPSVTSSWTMTVGHGLNADNVATSIANVNMDELKIAHSVFSSEDIEAEWKKYSFPDCPHVTVDGDMNNNGCMDNRDRGLLEGILNDPQWRIYYGSLDYVGCGDFNMNKQIDAYDLNEFIERFPAEGSCIDNNNVCTARIGSCINARWQCATGYSPDNVEACYTCSQELGVSPNFGCPTTQPTCGINPWFTTNYDLCYCSTSHCGGGSSSPLFGKTPGTGSPGTGSAGTE